MKTKIEIIDRRFDKSFEPFTFDDEYSMNLKITFDDNTRHVIDIPFSVDLIEDTVSLTDYIKSKLYEHLDLIGDYTEELSNEQKQHLSNVISLWIIRQY